MKYILYSLVFVFFVMAAVGCGGPAKSSEFSADNIMGAGGKTIKAKIYFSKDKWRMESNVGGHQSVNIVRLDKKVMWMLIPAQNMYMENQLSDEQMRGRTHKIPGEIERKKVGTEIVSGIKCDKYKISYKPEGGSKVTVVYQWLSADVIPVKTEAADGSWYSIYKNIKRGPQKASLFEIPAGYKKFSMPKMPMY